MGAFDPSARQNSATNVSPASRTFLFECARTLGKADTTAARGRYAAPNEVAESRISVEDTRTIFGFFDVSPSFKSTSTIACIDVGSLPTSINFRTNALAALDAVGRGDVNPLPFISEVTICAACSADCALWQQLAY